MSSKPVIADEPAAGLTFKEKSLWVTLLSTVGIYAYYFWRAIHIGSDNPTRVGELFVTVVIVYGVLHAIIHAAFAIHKRPERADERDRQVARRATHVAYYVLHAGVWGALGVAAMSLGTFWFVHAGLLALVLAEIARCASQLAYYRRGA